MIWKFVIYVLIGYIALCMVVFIFQRRMLYIPTTLKLSEEYAVSQGLHSWPSFENYQGWISQGQDAEPEGTIIVFHGNAGAAYHRTFYFSALSPLSLRVILAEYPGYGGRDGQPSEGVLVQDALKTIQMAHQEFGDPLFLWGESLGSGVVSSVVNKTPIPIRGVVLFTPWDTLPNLAQTHYWYFPTRWLVLDRFNNVENLQGYEGQIAVILAGKDEVVPVKHGTRLYDSLSGTKALWVFEDARHNEVPVGADLLWWKEVIDFIRDGLVRE